jgi:putative phage-type endonuclease
MYKVIHLEQNTPEWLKFRQEKIGASDAPIILGVSPWKNTYQLWNEKVHGKENFESQAMKRGKDLEESARSCFEQYTNSLIKPQVVESIQNPWMIASLDGIDISGQFIVEIKCPGYKDHSLAKEGKIPEKYIPQLQHQLAVIGLKEGYYFSYDGQDGHIVPFERDESYIENLIEKESDFYHNHILPKVPPKMNEDEEIVITLEDFDKLSEEYIYIDDKIKELQILKEELRDELINIADNRNVKNSFLSIKKLNKKGVVDYKRLCAEAGINEDHYRKESSFYWKIDTI